MNGSSFIGTKYRHKNLLLHRKEAELMRKRKEKALLPPLDFEPNMYIAALDGKITSVKFLYENFNAEINETTEEKRTPLHAAAMNGYLNIVQYFIEHCHAKLKIRDINGYTAMHYAAQNGHLLIVKYLAEYQQISDLHE